MTQTYFVFADVEPKELMTFGVTTGIPLDTDTTLEVFGHLIALWAVSREERFDELRVLAQEVFDVTLALYALIRLDRGAPRMGLRATQHSWLEARGVEARENVVGTVHARYGAGGVTEVDGALARDFVAAARAAWRFVPSPHLRLAYKDMGQSLRQAGPDAFLYAFRAVENARRFFSPDSVSTTRRGKQQTEVFWDPLHDALGTSKGQIDPLTDAATAVRHGGVEESRIPAKREDRERTLAVADDVLRRLAKHQGVSW